MSSILQKAIVLTVLGCFSSLNALPSGAHNIKGEVYLNQSEDGRTLDVASHGKAIIHWESFDIASNHAVSFSQAHKESAILNRITGGSKSYILGKLSANCPLFIVNEKGIVFGSMAQVETAGLIASTADISNESFWGNGDFVFENLKGGSILNLGSITSKGGDILFIARSIENHGLLHAPEGKVTFTTTEMILESETKQKVFIRLGEDTAPEEGIQNSGTIQALSTEFKTHSPYEKAIRHSGTIEATQTKNKNGRIYLVADHGGIDVETSLSAPGGEIHILGKDVRLNEQAQVDVSSEHGGGTLLVGGDFKGKNAHADSVHVGPGVSLLANATEEGNGGKVIVWSEKETLFDGKTSACGGPNGGNGGLIEISTRGDSYRVTSPIATDASAPQGKVGQVLFDPKKVFIQSKGTDLATGQTFASDPAGTATISGSSLQSAINTADVTIQANTDIYFMDTVEAETPCNGLKLQAGRSIQFLNGGLTLNNGNFSATINDVGAVTDRDSGIAQFNSLEGVIQTQGGNITIDIGTFGGTPIGEILISSSSLDAGGGNISLTGFARQDGTSNVSAISIGNMSKIRTTEQGGITLNGTGGNGANGNNGIYLGGMGSVIEVDSGSLSLIGTGGGNGTGKMNTGIISSASLRSIGSGSITLTGTSGIGTDLNSGICLQGGGVNSGIETINGDVTLTGKSQGTGQLNFGVRFESGPSCNSTGNGTIKISGISGTGTTNNHGLIFSSGSITSTTAPISIIGFGQGSDKCNFGVRLEAGATITSIENAPITIEGTANSGSDMNFGISLASGQGGIFAKDGSVSLTGASFATGGMNKGVLVEGGIIQSTGTGESVGGIHITGTGGPGTNQSDGIDIQGTETSKRITSIDSNITLIGKASAGNTPISIYPSNAVSITGDGTLTLTEN